MTTDEYNGWTNRETWALNLWLTNDEGLYEPTRERVAEVLAEYVPSEYASAEDMPLLRARAAGEAVKELWEELTDPTEELMSAENIITIVKDVGSDYRIEWDEIGKFWADDYDESGEAASTDEGVASDTNTDESNDLDTSSSASRQHYIDTGEYLRNGEAVES